MFGLAECGKHIFDCGNLVLQDGDCFDTGGGLKRVCRINYHDPISVSKCGKFCCEESADF